LYTHTSRLPYIYISFFFNAPPPTEIYTLSLHDALPICDCRGGALRIAVVQTQEELEVLVRAPHGGDRAHAAEEEKIEGWGAEYWADRRMVEDGGGCGGRHGWGLLDDERQR